MEIIIGLLLFISWYVVGIALLRTNKFSGNLFVKRSDFAFPIFTLFVPMGIIFSEGILMIIVLIRSRGFIDTLLMSFLFMLILIPACILIYNRMKVTSLRKHKNVNEATSKSHREAIVSFSSSLSEYKDLIEIFYYTYTTSEGAIEGLILIEYQTEQVKKAVLENKNKLPPGINIKLKLRKERD